MRTVISIFLHALLFTSAAVPAQHVNAAYSDAEPGIQPGIYCSSSIGMIYEPAEQITACTYAADVSYPEEDVQLLKLYHQAELSYTRKLIRRENGSTELIRTMYPERTIEERYDEQGRLISEIRIDDQESSETRYKYENGLLTEAETFIDGAFCCRYLVKRDSEMALRILQETRHEVDAPMKFLLLDSEAAAVGTAESFYVWKETDRTDIEEKWENGICIQSVSRRYEENGKKIIEIIHSTGKRVTQLFERENLIREEISSPGHHEITEYTYAENGKPAEIITIRDGRRSSVLFAYSSTNELREKIFMEDGVTTRIETYADGNLRKTDIYSNGRLIDSGDHEGK